MGFLRTKCLIIYTIHICSVHCSWLMYTLYTFIGEKYVLLFIITTPTCVLILQVKDVLHDILDGRFDDLEFSDEDPLKLFVT